MSMRPIQPMLIHRARPQTCGPRFWGQTAYNPNRSPPQFGVASTAAVVNAKVNGKMRSVVYVGGGNGTFYALDAATGAILWSRFFGATSQGYFLWALLSGHESSLVLRGAKCLPWSLVCPQFIPVEAWSLCNAAC